MPETTEAPPKSTNRNRGIFPSYLAPIDQFLLADDTPDHPMTFVIQMECDGVFDRSDFETALIEALDRHPLLRAFVRPAKQNKPCWVDCKGVATPISWGDRGEPIDCPREGFDLANETALRIWVRQDAEQSLVTFQFQHAATDGTGAFRFIGDLLVFYDRLQGGERSEVLDLDPALLRERRRRMSRAYAAANNRELWAAGWRQIKSLFWNRSAVLAAPITPGHFAFPGILVHTFDREQTRALRAVADTKNLMLNDLLIAALFLTLRDWNRRQESRDGSRALRILMPTDLRDSSETEMPAANFVAYTFLNRQPSECNDHAELLRSIGAETAQIKYSSSGTDFIDAISAAERFPWLVPFLLRRSRCLATAVLTNNGDPARRMTAKLPRTGGRLHTGGITVQRFSGVPPLRPKTRAAFCAMTYARELTISLRGDPQLFREEDTQALLDIYVGCLKQFAELVD